MSTINLLPDNYIRRRNQHQANKIFLFLFVVVVAGVLGAVAVSERSVGHTLDVRDRVSARYAEAGKLIAQMRRLEAQKRRMLHKAELAKELIERVPRSTLLGTVNNALPNGTSLVKLELSTRHVIRQARPAKSASGKSGKLTTEQRAPKAEPGPAVVSMEITGLAPTDIEVARLIANLARTALTDTVDLVYSQEKEHKKAKVREFQITMTLKPGVDAIELVNPQAHRAVPGGALLAAEEESR